MGVKIISFMKTALGKTDHVFHELQNISQVKELFYITGKFDLAMILEADTSEHLNEIFLQKIDTIDGITISNSHLIMKRWERQ